MKRLVSLCLVFLLLTVSVASAAGDNIVYWSGDWRYRYVTENTVEIAGYVGANGGVTLPTSLSGMKVVRIGDYAFSNTHVMVVTIPDEISDISPYAFDDCSVTTIKVSASHPTLEVVDGVIYSKADKSLVYYPPRLPHTHYEVKSGTAKIRTNAFHSCLNLCTVSFPDSLRNIAPAAITWCENLTEIVLPEGVVLINDEGFASNSSLSRVTIPASVYHIGMFAFSGCSNDLLLFVEPGSYAESYAQSVGIPYSEVSDNTVEPDAEVEPEPTIVPTITEPIPESPSVSDGADIELVIQQRNALYLQLLEAGITPCVDLSSDPSFQESPTTVITTEPVLEGEGYIVTDLYQWTKRDTQHVAFLLCNTTESTCYFVVRTVFYDENNNIVGVQNDDTNACSPGEGIIIHSSNDIPFERFELDVTVKKSSRHDASEVLKITTSRVGNKLILIGENTGAEPIKFPEYYCFYFSGNTVVDYDWGYLERTIEAGEMAMLEMTPYEDFDRYVVYVHGYYE